MTHWCEKITRTKGLHAKPRGARFFFRQKNEGQKGRRTEGQKNRRRKKTEGQTVNQTIEDYWLTIILINDNLFSRKGAGTLSRAVRGSFLDRRTEGQKTEGQKTEKQKIFKGREEKGGEKTHYSIKIVIFAV